MKTPEVKIGNILMGGDRPIVVQTMCNTHTADVEATVAQCIRLAKAGSELIRITVPGRKEVDAVREIKARLRAQGIDTPLVADIHFSAETALAVAPVLEKVRINPGNFHPDHEKARALFARFLEVCKANGTAIRIGLNHGSLGSYIVERFGNTPEAMALAAMEWVEMCREADFHQAVVSLKASNTVVMVEAYRHLARLMEERGIVFPLHVGVTEAGNGDSGRIKSCAAISTLLSEGIGNTVRVSLTEDPEAEIPVAQYLSDRHSRGLRSSLQSLSLEGKCCRATYAAPSRERLLLDASCDFGKRLLSRELDEVSFSGTYIDAEGHTVPIDADLSRYLGDELLQACRRRFYKPEYIACPGCGRTLYNLQDTFEKVKAHTGHFKDVVIAVMGCIVNGPGEMADADYGYVGEGAGKVTLYKAKTPVLRHIPEEKAVDLLVQLIEADKKV